MMTHLKISFILIAMLLQGCNYSVVKSTENSSLNTPFNIVSKASFNSTARPLLLQHCAACHAGSARPLHASSDLDLAYGEITSYALVDFGNITNSRFYRRLSVDQHNCWNGDCQASAQEMLAALQAWKAANEAAPVPDDPTRTLGPVTAIPGAIATAPADLSLSASATELKFTMDSGRNVVFSIRVEKLDASTYRLFWPAILAPSGVKVNLKDLKFKMNGNLLTDVAFAYLNRQVTGQGAATPVVLDSFIVMTIAVQNGPGSDQLAPSFGAFTLQ